MSTTSTTNNNTKNKNDHEVPLGAPISSPIKGGQSVRKRIAAHPVPRLWMSPPPSSTGNSNNIAATMSNNTNSNPNTTTRLRINPHLIYRDYAHTAKPRGPVSIGMRIRNFVTIVLMISFPLSIFFLPIWWHTPTYPRVVVAVTTTHDRLPLLQPTLQAYFEATSTTTLGAANVKRSSSLLLSPDMVYLILPKSDQQQLDANDVLHKVLPDRTMRDDMTRNIQILYSTEQYENTVTSSALAAIQQEQLMHVLAEQHNNKDSSPINNNDDGQEELEDRDASESILGEVRDTDRDGGDTRIVVVADHSFPNLVLQQSQRVRGTPLLQLLVEASQQYPDAVLSGVGGHWRSHFRQIKRVLTTTVPDATSTRSSSSSSSSSSSLLLDKFPNVVLHQQQQYGRTVSPPVDILETATTGVIFRMGTILPVVKSFQDHLHRLRKNENKNVDPAVLELEAGDVVWSGLLHAHNRTRRIVRTQGSGSSGAASTIRTGGGMEPTVPATDQLSRRHWMVAAFQLQEQWNIWEEYIFWDWSTLSKEQKEAMKCEGQFEPDCGSSSTDKSTSGVGVVEEDKDISGSDRDAMVLAVVEGGGCRPNPQHCGDETPFGPILAALSSSSKSPS